MQHGADVDPRLERTDHRSMNVAVSASSAPVSLRRHNPDTSLAVCSHAKPAMVKQPTTNSYLTHLEAGAPCIARLAASLVVLYITYACMAVQ